MSPVLGIIASSNQQGRGGGPVGAYDSLATVVVPSGGLSSITFAGIPVGYDTIEIRGTYLASAANEDCLVRLSGDTTANYSWHEIRGDGSSTPSSRGVANTSFMYLGANSGSTTYPFSFIFNIPDYYSPTKFKTMRTLSGQDRNGTGGGVSVFSGNWRNLNPVSSVTIYMASGTFNQYSEFSMYGVK